MAEFSENRHISNLINMSCKVMLIHYAQWLLDLSANSVFFCTQASYVIFIRYNRSIAK